MSNVNNFSLVGIGSNVRFGKGNGFVSFTSGSGFYVKDASNALTNLSIAEPTAGTHATTKNYVDTITGGTALTAGSGINFTAGVISTKIDGSTIVFNSGTMAVGTVQTANINDAAITTSKIGSNQVTYSKIQQAGASKILGNPGTAAADVSEIAIGTNLVLGTNGTLALANSVNLSGTIQASNFAAGATVSGSNTGDQTITLTGDVTGSGTGSFATTLADTGVTAASYTLASFTVDSKGRLTAANTTSIGSGLTYSGTTLSANVDGATIIDTGGSLAVGTISGNQVSGGTLTTTQITGLNNPVGATDAVNKNYVDSLAAGLDSKQAVAAATTTNLAATYSSGTLTASGNGALVVDGYTVLANDRVLVQDQTTKTQNGIYTVSATGGTAAPFVLVRATDMNVSSEVPGAYTFVIGGTSLAGNGYVVTGFPENGVLDTNDIVFTQFSQAGAYGSATGGGLSLDSSTVPAVFKMNFTNMTAAGALGSANLVPLSQDGTNVVKTTLGSIASFITGGSALGAAVGTGLSQAALTYAGGTFTLNIDNATIIDSGTGLAVGTIQTGNIANSAVTYAKIQNVGISKLLGNPGTAAAAPSEISIGTGLALGTNGTLSMATSGVTAGTYGDNTHTSIVTVDALGRVTNIATGATALGTGSVTSITTGTGLTGGPITNAGTVSVAANGISYALMQQASGATLLGNPTGSTANVSEITLGTGGLAFTGTNLTVVVDGSSIINTSGTLGVKIESNGGLAILSGVGLDYTNLAAGGTTLHSSDIIAVAQGGEPPVAITFGELAQATEAFSPDSINATIGTTNSSNIGQIFNANEFNSANNSWPKRVVLNVTVAYTGGNATQLIVTDGTSPVTGNVYMTAAENDIATTGVYVADLPIAFPADGSSVTAWLVQNDGSTLGTTTAGAAKATIEWDIF